MDKRQGSCDIEVMLSISWVPMSVFPAVAARWMVGATALTNVSHLAVDSGMKMTASACSGCGHNCKIDMIECDRPPFQVMPLILLYSGMFFTCLSVW